MFVMGLFLGWLLGSLSILIVVFLTGLPRRMDVEPEEPSDPEPGHIDELKVRHQRGNTMWE